MFASDTEIMGILGSCFVQVPYPVSIRFALIGGGHCLSCFRFDKQEVIGHSQINTIMQVFMPKWLDVLPVKTEQGFHSRSDNDFGNNRCIEYHA